MARSRGDIASEVVRGDGVRVVLRSQPHSLWRQIARARLAYAWLAPIFLALGVFVYYPPLSAMYHAFFDWNPSGQSTFVGLGNFQLMLSDNVLGQSFINMAKLLAFGLVVGVTVPLLVAEMIFAVRGAGAQYAYRLLFLIPVVAPGVVVILLWRFIYDPNVGLLNDLLGAVGLGGLQHAWLGEFGTALYALMFIGFPFVSGTSVLIYLAGLINIPTEVLEAAQLDGVTGLRRIWSIDVPLLLGQIKLFIVLGIIGIVQGFGTQLILGTDGGPGYATEVPGLKMYQEAFEGSRFGYASAIGLVLFIIVLVFTIISFTVIRPSSEFEGRRA
jgi:multiple sugar transport system permease protein/raffinose/stachyose/melibiose transport system permease protein